MAVPKRKVSKQRKRTRAANWKVSAPTLQACPKCNAMKISHRVCKHCGHYYVKKELVQVIAIKGEAN